MASQVDSNQEEKKDVVSHADYNQEEKMQLCPCGQMKAIFYCEVLYCKDGFHSLYCQKCLEKPKHVHETTTIHKAVGELSEKWNKMWERLDCGMPQFKLMKDKYFEVLKVLDKISQQIHEQSKLFLQFQEFEQVFNTMLKTKEGIMKNMSESNIEQLQANEEVRKSQEDQLKKLN